MKCTRCFVFNVILLIRVDIKSIQLSPSFFTFSMAENRAFYARISFAFFPLLFLLYCAWAVAKPVTSKGGKTKGLSIYWLGFGVKYLGSKACDILLKIYIMHTCMSGDLHILIVHHSESSTPHMIELFIFVYSGYIVDLVSLFFFIFFSNPFGMKGIFLMVGGNLIYFEHHLMKFSNFAWNFSEQIGPEWHLYFFFLILLIFCRNTTHILSCTQ